MAIARLDGRKITDWPSFHRESQKQFGFPDFYGSNMDAWIDCLSGLRDGDSMSAFSLMPDEALQINVLHAAILRNRAPHILAALEECVAAVNERYIECGEKPAVALALH